MADPTASPKENVLYVIFHGLVSLVDLGDPGFNAYLFDVGTIHRYLFGNWLVESDALEQKQPPKVLTLASVVGAVRDPLTNVLNPDLNLVIQLNAPPSPTLSSVRTVIHLPRPRRIYYYTCGGVPKDSIAGDLSKLVNGHAPSFISGVRVFEYTFTDAQTPQLLAGDPPAGDSLWDMDFLAELSNRKVATLHFYNEPGQAMDDDAAEQHARSEFLLSTALLGVPLQLTQPSNGNKPIPPGQPELEKLGILGREVTPLDERSEALLDLQFFARCLKSRPKPLRDEENGGDGGDDGGDDPGNAFGGGGGPICGGGNAQVQ
jgi:uncharacterized membrane protein YgcG